jgi:hypothetical protein
MERLNCKILVVDEIPSTQYTKDIPGGRGIFWGMALNKLHVFNLTQYKKLIWMDGDTMLFKNVDHLFKEPAGTMSFTYACCNPNAPVIPSGGHWIVEPTKRLGEHIWKMMEDGKPIFDPKNGGWQYRKPQQPETGVMVEYWHWGDMQIVRHLFSQWVLNAELETLWPQVDDIRHGFVPGAKLYPKYRDMSDQEFRDNMVDRWRRPMEEGFIPAKLEATIHNQSIYYNERKEPVVWRALSAHYDQCVGHCECIPSRDMPDEHWTVHFSCIQKVNKPSGYQTEEHFMHDMYHHAKSCTRYYYMKWYELFRKAHGRLPPPYWSGPEIPIYNASHDELVEAHRKASGDN